MRVLLWWPGASVAVADVAAGLSVGLSAQGVEVQHYRTDAYIESAGHMLTKIWRRTKAQGVQRWTAGDLLYEANKGILERALRARVTLGLDWVIAVSGMYQHPDYFAMLREAGCRVALVCTESPYSLAEEMHVAPLCDVIFTNERSTLAAFRTVQPRSYYLPLAYHPLIHQYGAATTETDEPVRAHDVVFVGTGFIERVDLIRAMDWSGIDFGLYGVWGFIPPRARVRRQITVVEKDVPNTETARLYRAAKVGLNLHRTSTGYGKLAWHVRHAESLNPRCYELAACGKFFVSDWRAEAQDIFGDALPTFTTPAGCEAVIRRALQDDAWREDTAAACAERVQPHDWIARAGQVLDVLSDCAARAA